MTSTKSQHKTSRLATRLRVVYLAILAITVAIIIAIGSLISMEIANDSARRLSRQYAIEAAANFLTSTNTHLVLSQQLAHSTTVAHWLANEDDAQSMASAIEEITRHLAWVPYMSLMFTVYDSRNVYDLRTGFTGEDLAPARRVEHDAAWFGDTLRIQRGHPVEGQWSPYIWMNHRMYHEGRFVGFAAVGLPWQIVFDAVFGDFDMATRRGYIIDHNGLVRADSAQVLEVLIDGYANPVSMPEALYNPALAHRIHLHLQTMVNGVYQLGGVVGDAIPLDGDFRYASIAPIVGTSWSVVVLSNYIWGTGTTRFIPLWLASIAVMVFLAWGGRALVRRIEREQKKLLDDSEESAAETRNVLALIQMMLDSAPLVITLWNDRYECMNVSGYTLKLFKIKDKKEYIENFNAFSPEFQPCGALSAEKAVVYFERAFQEGYVNFKWIHQTKNGEPVSMDITISRFEYSGKTMLVAYALDIREAEVAMALERNAFDLTQKMIDLLPFVMNMYNAEKELISTSEHVVRLFGVESKQEYLKNWFNFSPEYQPCGTLSSEKAAVYVAEAFETGTSRFRWIHQTKSGEPIPMQITLSRFEHKGKYMLCTFAADLREIEATLAKVKETSAKEQELTQRVLEEQKRIEVAEEKNKAKSEFLARMSHEIRTPISSILGISEIGLQTSVAHPTAEDYFAKIHSSGKLLLGIINDILDFSKIEGGKMTVAQEEYNISSLIGHAVNLHYAYLGDKGIQFSLRVDEELPLSLVGDMLRIEQIIINLLSNAFKYTDAGEVTLSLQCRPLKPGHTTLVITVSDTGLGMSAEQLAIVFDDYTRFHEREKSNVSGTGLGMSIVSNLVHMMDATIEMESEVGVGTTVTVSIPQKIATQDMLGKEAAQKLQQYEIYAHKVEKRRKFVPEPMPYGRVLVVDDMQANLYVAQGLLAFYALHVETCNSGKEAIDKIKQGNVYDIVFMDHMMPGINGPEAMKILRDMGYTHPIVVLTANALVGQEEEYIKNGFDAFLSKPIMTDRLNAILNKYIRDKQPPEVIEAAKRESIARQPVEGAPQGIDDFNMYVLGKLRMDFAKIHKNAFIDITHAIDAGDMETAHIVAHTLKSLAELINEHDLAQTARSIEGVLADKKAPTDEQLSVLERELSQVLERIGTPGPAVFPGHMIFDKDKAKMIFDALYPLLASHQTASTDFLDELRAMPEMAVLAQQIEDFDFKQAMKTLDTLKKILAI
ncbi:MAG: ATP-binding protein [Defluviitaleaceae bacterium]|nr:ATP-binding protein [Defluviitaleaceae bacterium]MCL2239040.1 ATP-binding protein [Defluviitaleaceae bacterium]